MGQKACCQVQDQIDLKNSQQVSKEQISTHPSTTGNISISRVSNEIKINSPNRVDLKAVGGSLFKDIHQVYKFQEVIAHGNFGTVRVGYKYLDDPPKFYAIKSISKKNLSKSELKDLIREVSILSLLDHPNIARLYETYHDQNYLHIVMELCRGKEVYDKLHEEGKLTEQRVSNIIMQVLSAISYCHSKGISHRDLKPDNLLFESTDQDAEIKLIDFGFSRKYGNNEKMHTIIGTPYYVAPEVLTGEYDEKCDVWAIGVLAYTMLCGNPPFRGKTNHEIFQKVIKKEPDFAKEQWESISANAIDFIKKCLTKQPEKRFTASKALLHPWFTNILKRVHSDEFLSSDILNNLKNFSYPQKFKKMILRFLVSMLNQSEIKKLNQAFYAIDYDHTGHITLEEIQRAFKISGIQASEDDIRKIINEAGDTMEGKIDYSEFVVASLNQKYQIDKEMLASAFQYFDVDNSGYIDSSDLSEALLRSGKKIIVGGDINRIIEEVANQEKISLEDFLKLF